MEAVDKLFRLFKNYLRPQWKWVLVALIAAQVSSMSSFTIGYLSKTMVDTVLQIGSSGKARGSRQGAIEERGIAPSEREPTPEIRAPGMDERIQPVPSGADRGPRKTSRAERLHLLKLIFVGYFCVRIFFAALSWFYSYVITKVGQDLIYGLRKEVYDKLQSLQMSYFDRHQTGKIMARVMDDVDVIQSSVSSVFINLLTNVTMLVVGAVILFNINAQMSLVAFCTLPFYVFTYRRFLSRIRAVGKFLRERNAEIYGVIGENLRGVRIIKSFARERYERRRFFHKISQHLRLQARSAVLHSLLSTLCGLISGIGTTILLYLGIVAMQDGSMTLGSFLFFYGSVGLLFSPVVALSEMNVSIQWVLVALERVFVVLDEEVTIEEPENAVEMKEIYGEVIFRHVSLRYENAPDDALKDLHFAVMPGSLVCIAGRSGSGKTSLVNLLLRLYDPTDGRITVDGEDIRDISLKSLRRHIRMVPQEPTLFSGTLASNIRYGLPEASPSQVMEAAKKAELHDFITTLPAKYETEIGEGGVSLSGGQRQRMSLAMTLITDPSVLILDDSTSALDAETEARIQDTVGKIAKDRTTFVITQKVAMCRRADLVLVLERGRLVEQGTYDKLVRQTGAFYDLFRAQIEAMERGAPEERAEEIGEAEEAVMA